MTKLERKLKVAIKALEFYANLPKHTDHPNDEIHVGTCVGCEFNCNRESIAKTALYEIEQLQKK
jgi:hypothetical protein